MFGSNSPATCFAQRGSKGYRPVHDANVADLGLYEKSSLEPPAYRADALTIELPRPLVREIYYIGIVLLIICNI